jgi:hypothetical protein
MPPEFFKVHGVTMVLGLSFGERTKLGIWQTLGELPAALPASS